MAGYNAGFAAFYDSLIGEVDYGKRADFIIKQIKRFKDRCELVLDLACGTGLLSVELANRGIEVIGVDASPEMLMKAAEKSAGISPPPLYLCQTMEELDLYGTVDAAVCMQDSLNHLEGIEALEASFQRLWLFVEPGGIVLFDMNTPYKHRKVLGNQTFVYDTQQVYCVWQNFYDPRDNAVDIQLDLFGREGDSYHRSSESFTEYSYTSGQIEELLEQSGFELLEIQGDYNGKPPKATEERLVFIAKRKET